MARIRSIRIGSPSGAVHPTDVDAEVKRVNDDAGRVLIQLTTFGSDARRSLPKTSQTIQMDRKWALRLAEIIHETFGDDD